MLHAGKAFVAAGLLVTMFVPGVVRADETSAVVPDGQNVVGGIPTNLQPTTGALLFVGPDLKNQFLDCSGVLIGCRTVLTAAHCICKNSANATECNNEIATLDVADLRFFFQHSGFHHVRDIYISPTFFKGTGGDLAVLRLSERVDGIEPSRYHQSFPTTISHGTDAIIAGFGNSADDAIDAAIKRVGAVTTTECEPQQGIYEPANICWDFTDPILSPGGSNLCLKDDGGPLFIDFGNGPEVAGIHAGGGDSCQLDSYSYDTNVVRSRDWIKEVGGLDITRDQCSELGEVGEPWVKVQGGAGTLPKDQSEMRFAFDIPTDSLLVRVAVNGDTAKDGDYDMFVGLDTKIPTKFVNDCKSVGVGQFGFCSFVEPDAGRVNVLIRHVRPHVGRGRSRFQVTVTAFQVVPPHEDPPRGPDMLRFQKRGSGLRTLTWEDDSDNETGFELQRRPGTDPTASFTKRATIKADRISYLESIADTDVFTYRIRAFNLFGASEWSNLCVVNHPRLRRPTRLRTEAIGAESVTLLWKDNTSNESNMELQRRLSGALRWRTLKTLPADTVRYVDNGVVPGENYEYRVRARGYDQECIPHSRYSDILEVTTPAL